jgi:lipopolysaccharide/colanic/teichoic acid biosynthesis glycosyltransferase
MKDEQVGIDGTDDEYDTVYAEEVVSDTDFSRYESMETADATRVARSTTGTPAVVPMAQPIPLGVRLFEISVALLVLVLTSPIMLIEAVIIRRGTPGPVLFLQQRVGINRKPFTFVKFRTLYADARQRFPHLYAYKYTDEELRTFRFKVERDPRVTPQGAWLRAASLDELPNFWCVLRGDMALVGPRPEIPEMLPYYHGDMLKKFSVRPGITGYAQISGRGRLTFFETVKYDVEYVEKRSFLLDLKILWKTVEKVILRHGAF